MFGKVRLALIAVLGSLGMMLLPGCSTAPDRSAAATKIADVAKAMPGVDRLDVRYAHGMTEGYGVYLVVWLTDAATVDQARQVSKTVFERFGTGGFQKHSMSLQIRRGRDTVAMFGRFGHSAPPQEAVTTWFSLSDLIEGELNFNVVLDRSPVLQSVTVRTEGSLASVIAHARPSYPDLPGAQWIVHTGGNRVDLFGSYPDDAVSQTIDKLIAGSVSMTFKYQGGGPSPVLSVLSAVAATDRLEPVARAQLAMLDTVQIPVNYAIRSGEGGRITVKVRGCSVGNSTVEQELNRQYGNC